MSSKCPVNGRNISDALTGQLHMSCLHCYAFGDISDAFIAFHEELNDM